MNDNDFKYEVGDIIQLSPKALQIYRQQGNYWWRAYNINDEEVDEITCTILYVGYFISMVPTKDFSHVDFSRDLPCRLAASDVIPTNKAPLTQEERIIRRIYKLYSKCSTTKQWVQGSKNAA